MGLEIERKFLVLDDSWREQADAGKYYRQGYLASDEDSGIRVSLSAEESRLTIKKAVTTLRRLEFEYDIPRADARDMLDLLCTDTRIEKTRYLVTHAGHVWEVDVFAGSNAGLTVAEIELSDENEPFEPPHWLGQEVSSDPRYYAMNLARKPYPTW